VQCHLPQCAWKGENLQQRLTHRRTLSKQSLRGQVSAKLTLEICINNASSNSRLTAAGRQATAADSHSQYCLQTLFFLSRYLWWENNWTTAACWKTYWNCIAFQHGTLCGFFFFVCVYVCVKFCSTLCIPFDETTTEQHLRHHIQDWRLRQTPKLLRLKLHCIWTWRFFLLFSIFHFVSFYFIFIYFFLHLLIFYFYSYLYSFYFLFFIFNPLSL
jgi:hypothetical protein